MFVVDSSLLTDELGDLRRPMFDQLDKFVSSGEGSTGLTPNRTD